MAWLIVLPSGRYRAMYRDKNGRQRSAGTFDHKKRATNAAAAAEAEANSKGWRDPDASDRTWGDWATERWDTRKLEPSTKASETYLLTSYLIPRWGTVPLGEITRNDGRAWITKLSKTERRISAAEQDRRKAALAANPKAVFPMHYLAASSVQRIVGLFAASLNAAVDAEIIQTNPVFRLKLPPRPPAGERFLTHAEFRRDQRRARRHARPGGRRVDGRLRVEVGRGHGPAPAPGGPRARMAARGRDLGFESSADQGLPQG